MRRTPLYLLVLLLSASLAHAQALSREQREASIRYVNSLQNEDGGFRPAVAPGPSQLGATSSSLRALKYLGGTPRDRAAVERFILRCYDPATGGFADTPGGKVDVRSTAMGLMASAEVKLPLGERREPVLAYLARNARALPDAYIAVAGLDAAGLKLPAADTVPWLTLYEGSRNPDGSYGKSAGDTAGAVITRLRLGESVSEREKVVRLLREAQRPDGGFAAMGDTSDLSTSYRVMRALQMLKERPDLERLRAFVARCRNADGGYGPAPGQPSTGPATYYAAIILHWSDELGRG